MFLNYEFSYDISSCLGRTNYRILLGRVEKPRVISDRSVGVLWLLVYGDWLYSKNLGSTIGEHRPCHFRSSTIGGVTKVVSEHCYTMLEWDLFQILFESKIKVSQG